MPPADMRTLRDRCGSACQLVEISSMYGHDAFFKESAVLRDAAEGRFGPMTLRMAPAKTATTKGRDGK